MTNIELRIQHLHKEKARLILEKGELEARYNSIEERPKWVFWLVFRNKYELLNALQMQIRSIQDFIDDVNRNLRFLHRAKAATDESENNGNWKMKN